MMSKLVVFGVIISFGSIIGGGLLEGADLSMLFHFSAALIVLGGSFGAVVIQSNARQLHFAFAHLIQSFKSPEEKDIQQLIERVKKWSKVARKDGLLGLETLSESEKNIFAKKGLTMLVDGASKIELRSCLETEMIMRENRALEAAFFFQSMGGYAPTIGIIGAVMGLIQVMGNLADPALLGDGIAVAFVATIYGVAFANLLFIPIANKIKQQVYDASYLHEMLVEAILAIADGENTRSIERRLKSYALS